MYESVDLVAAHVICKLLLDCRTTPDKVCYSGIVLLLLFGFWKLLILFEVNLGTTALSSTSLPPKDSRKPQLVN